jgi:threonine/homoserine/homoserine lactone efflux protein
MSIEFLLTSLVIVATPGTGVLYTLMAGISHGARMSVVAAAACTLAIVPHALAAVTGLAALLHTSALAFETLKYLGVAYLLYMAWRTFRDKSALTVERETVRPSVGRVVASGVLVNLLNPKVTIFFVAFLPQFVDPNSPGSVRQMLELSGVFMLMTFLVFVGFGVCAASVRTYIISRPVVVAWTRRIFGGTFLALGARLALARR